VLPDCVHSRGILRSQPTLRRSSSIALFSLSESLLTSAFAKREKLLGKMDLLRRFEASFITPIKILRKWEEICCRSQLALSEASSAGTASTLLGCEVPLNLYLTLPWLKIGTTYLSPGSLKSSRIQTRGYLSPRQI